MISSFSAMSELRVRICVSPTPYERSSIVFSPNVGSWILSSHSPVDECMAHSILYTSFQVRLKFMLTVVRSPNRSSLIEKLAVFER